VTVCTFLDDEIYSKCFCNFCSYFEGDMLSICVSSLTTQTSGPGTTIPFELVKPVPTGFTRKPDGFQFEI
jgi:hypothetical protein